MVDVPKGPPTEIRCGGTLIGQDWVLTAAECDNPKLVAILGQEEAMEKREKIKIKERHTYQDMSGKHNLMLLKLDRPMVKWFSTKYQVIGLPSKDDCHKPKVGTNIKLVGWKQAGLALEPSTFLPPQYAPQPVCGMLSVAECPDLSQHKQSKEWLDKSFSYTDLVCAGGQSDNTCTGAAGGGLIYNSMLYGVVKGSTKASCSSPVKFTSVCKYRDWILKIRGK